MSNKITGKVYHVGEVLELGDNGFTKREFVIETEGEYPQKIKLELVKDYTSKVDESMLGETITVSFQLQGREHDGKFYTNVKAWKIEKHS